VLLLGPRQTGKSSLIRNQVKATRAFNLLEADTYRALLTRPSLIRESIVADGELIVIDEVQKLPELFDEAHAMIEERGAWPGPDFGVLARISPKTRRSTGHA
jgi:predicted AAA+ superfamily ATPase